VRAKNTAFAWWLALATLVEIELRIGLFVEIALILAGTRLTWRHFAAERAAGRRPWGSPPLFQATE